MPQTVNYHITGQVQGVGFRRFIMLTAQRLGIKGFVSNLEDGAVECSVQGPMEALTEFEMQLRQGPPGAQVDSLDCEDVDIARRYTQFRIV